MLGGQRGGVSVHMGTAGRRDRTERVAVKQFLDCRTSLSFIFLICRMSKMR